MSKTSDLGGDELQRIHETFTEDWPLMGEDDFWNDLQTILTNCEEILGSAGWEKSFGSHKPDHRDFEPFSEEWYAGQIGAECWNFLSNHRADSPNPVMLAQAVFLGRLLADYEFRAAHGRAATSGKKQRKTLAQHRATAAENRWAEARERREILATLFKSENISKGMGAVEKSLQARLRRDHSIDVSTRTIRRDLKKIGQTG